MSDHESTSGGKGGKPPWESLIASAVALGTFVFGVFTWWDNRHRPAEPARAAEVVVVPAEALAPKVAEEKAAGQAGAPATGAESPAAARPEPVDSIDELHHLRMPNGKGLYFYRNESVIRPHPEIKRAIVAVPANLPHAKGSFDTLVQLAKDQGKLAETLILVPRFPVLAKELRKDELHWPSGWDMGQECAGSEPMSAFDVVDLLCRRLADPALFPNLKALTIVGHTTGSMFVSRYIAFGKAIGDEEGQGRIDLRFAAMTVATYLYLDKNRPVPGTDRFEVPRADDCKGFNSYRFGLEHRPPHLDAIPDATIRANLFRRKLTILAGTEDTTDEVLDRACGAMLQGPNRFERARLYWQYIRRFPGWRDNVRFEPIPGVARLHDQHYLTAKPVIAALFGPFQPSGPDPTPTADGKPSGDDQAARANPDPRPSRRKARPTVNAR